MATPVTTLGGVTTEPTITPLLTASGLLTSSTLLTGSLVLSANIAVGGATRVWQDAATFFATALGSISGDVVQLGDTGAASVTTLGG